MTGARRLVAIALLAAVCGTFAVRAETGTGTVSDVSFDFGFIASRHKDVNGDWRLKILGPLYEHSTGHGMKMNAYRPLYSDVKDPANDRSLHDYLWPISTQRAIHDESQWRWLFFYGFNHTTNDPAQRYRLWLLPFYFQGRNKTGENYRALFPVGGTIGDFLGRDKISFFLFPLYSESSVNDVATMNVLWPLISRTRNNDGSIYRARFFPFYGVNEHKGKYRKRFILWPIYTEATYDYKHSKGGGHILFPLYGYMNLNTEKTIWVIPPLFRFTRGQERNVTYAPWPIYQRVSGENYDKHYVWPLWGRLTRGKQERTFYLWPFFWTEHDARIGTKSRRFMAVPFYSQTVVKSDRSNGLDLAPPKVVERRNKFWPIYSYSRRGEASRFRFVELWPFAEASAVERNLAPFWSIYTRYADHGNVDSELLWGLYRNQKRAEYSRYVSVFPVFDFTRDEQVDPPVRSWNILKGLIGFERRGAEKTYKFLYLIKIRTGKESPP